MQRFDRLRANGVKWVLILLTLMLCALALPAAAQTFPKFTGLVVDDANVLSPQVEAELTAKLEALQNDTTRQLVVATIADVQGYPLEDYGYKLGRAWGVGLRDVDNGAILFLAPNNPAGQRGPRIEVGRGLEPFITDALASVVINTAMMPKLRNGGDIAGAMTAGSDALIRQLRASPDEARARTDAAIVEFDKTNRRSGQRSGGFPIGLIVPIMILGFVGLSFLRRGGGGTRFRGAGSGVAEVVMWSIANEVARGALRGGGGGGGWNGGGGGSDGSWGGGGFTGGGGGDFGGGGASGDW